MTQGSFVHNQNNLKKSVQPHVMPTIETALPNVKDFRGDLYTYQSIQCIWDPYVHGQSSRKRV